MISQCLFRALKCIADHHLSLITLEYESVKAGMAGGLAYTDNLLPAAPVGLLGLLLWFQVMVSYKYALRIFPHFHFSL